MDDSPSPNEMYSALTDGFIRLLVVQPSTDRAARIECHLVAVYIEDSPYEALSYVWGQENAAHNVFVNNQEVLVRPNLYGALRELRQEDEPIKLWIDAICINQSDILERSSQVRLMSRIYSNATQVVVWLGEQDSTVDPAFDFMHGLSKLDADTVRRIESDSGLPWESRKLVFAALGMRHGINNYEEVSSGLKRLMCNPWWTRIWTVQEIVRAKSAVLRCGSKSVTWDCLSKLADFSFEVAHHNALSIGRPMDEAILDELTAEVSKLYIAVLSLQDLSYRVSHGAEIDLERLIWSQLLNRQAEDPLDMIYGLSGLLAKKHLVEIDYAKSKKQVYTNAMRTMLEGGRLHPLHFLQDCYLERDASLPSWVPDFANLHSFRTTNMATTSVGTSLTLGSLYDATHGEESSETLPLFLGDDGDILQLKGVAVDEVVRIGNVCPRFSNEWEERRAQLEHVVLQEWRQTISNTAVNDRYVGGDCSVSEAFWRTVTFDLLLEDRDYYAGNPDRRDSRRPKRSTGMPPTSEHEEMEILEGILDAPPPKTVLEKLGERRFFVTKLGYVGIGPRLARPRDTVSVLSRALFPTVIRRKPNGRYSLIGDSFVYGIMDGEILGSIKRGDYVRQTFDFE